MPEQGTSNEPCTTQAKPTIFAARDDLHYSFRDDAVDPHYVIEDALSGKFHQLGLREHFFLTQFDGCRDSSEVVAATNATFPNQPLTTASATELIRWLCSKELLQNATSDYPIRRKAAQNATILPGNLWGKLLVQRVTFGSPDGWIARFAPYTAWCFSSLGVAIGILALLVGTIGVLSEWNRFLSASAGVFAPSNWIWLLLAWLTLKIIHETGHALACKHFGGEVKEAGIVLIALAPLAFVNVSSSWRFESRWERLIVAVSGMAFELFVASVAAICWTFLPSGWQSHLCYVVVTTAAIGTLVFNANPLMRFDGYFILSDLLGIPNLYSRANQQASSLLASKLLGVTPRSPSALNPVFTLYGLATKLWRLAITISLFATAYALFENIASIAAIVCGCLFVFSKTQELSRQGFLREIRWERFAVTTCGLTSALLVTFLAPWPGAVSLPTVVDYFEPQVVRTEVDGFVEELVVSDGDQVVVGQVLARLRNRDLELEFERLTAETKQSELRCRQYEHRRELSELQNEQANLASLQKQLEHAQLQLNSLVLHAARDGTVVARNLDQRLGFFLNTGDALLTIADESAKELRMLIPEKSQPALEANNVTLHAFPTERSSFSVRISRLSPRATWELEEPALSAANGGPIEIRQVASTQPSDTAELFAPRFEATAILDSATSNSLAAGETLTTTCRPFDETVAQHFLSSFADRFEHLVSKQEW